MNLGFNSQGAYAFRFAEQDYLSLDYDTVILYEGYNDLGGRRTNSSAAATRRCSG